MRKNVGTSLDRAWILTLNYSSWCKRCFKALRGSPCLQYWKSINYGSNPSFWFWLDLMAARRVKMHRIVALISLSNDGLAKKSDCCRCCIIRMVSQPENFKCAGNKMGAFFRPKHERTHWTKWSILGLKSPSKQIPSKWIPSDRNDSSGGVPSNGDFQQ